jgi:hypothetical protein
VRLATSWVEPAYLEPDASWCEPGGEPASPLANGGAFGGKLDSPVGPAARELAGRLGRTVRTVFSREDVVRLGPKRPPVALSAVVDGPRVRVTGRAAGAAPGPSTGWPCPYRVDVDASIAAVAVAGPPASPALRAPFAELHVLLEGALDAAGVDRTDAIADARGARVLLDTVAAAGDARAGARVRIDDATGRIEVVDVRVAAGDPLDEVVLRSYAVGAAHMALGWVFSEGLAVDRDTGEVHDLTIRSFGIVPARNVPPIEVAIVDEPGPPIARSSDAVFAAVASAAWNAVTRADGERPEAFPALGTRASRMLRR